MDPDDPESFLKNLPPERAYIAQVLWRAGFNFDAEWFRDYEDDDSDDDFERDPYPEESAWYRRVNIDGHNPYRITNIIIANEASNPNKPTCYVACTDIEGRPVANYAERLTFAEAAAKAQELVDKLERRELEVINHRFRPVNESSYRMRKLTEGGHKAGCQCGFCKNKGKFGKKSDDDAKDKKDDGKKPTAESIVHKLLDT